MTDLTLEHIRERLGGEIVCEASGDAVRAPGPGRDMDDRSLEVRLEAGCDYGIFLTSLAEDPFPKILDYVLTRLGLERIIRNGGAAEAAGIGDDDEIGDDNEDDAELAEPDLFDDEKHRQEKPPRKRPRAKAAKPTKRAKVARGQATCAKGQSSASGAQATAGAAGAAGTPYSGAVGPERNAAGELIADPAQVGAFFEALFRHADRGGHLAMRIFHEDRTIKSPYDLKGAKVGRAKLAEWLCGKIDDAAQHPQPLVFCPPIATFQSAKGARVANLKQALALSVECDSDAGAAIATLTAILGPPTCVVASGGSWSDAADAVNDRLHGHWRLATPTGTPEEHQALHRLRQLATAIVGGDASNDPPVHPIRWPGSWHRKATPRRARLVTLDADAELEVADAWDRLSAAYPELAADLEEGRPGAAQDADDGGSSAPLAAIDDIIAALAVIPNDDVDWDHWKRVMMAVYRASECQGFDAFCTWSRKSAKHNDGVTLTEWRKLDGSRPTRIGAGSLFHWAAEAVPGWVKPSWAARAAHMPPDVDDDEETASEDPAGAQSSGIGSSSSTASAPPPAGTKKPIGRRRIELKTGRLAETADEVIAALAAAEAPLFIRGHMLVRPFSSPAKTYDGLETHVPAMAQVTPPMLLDYISRHVKLMRFDRRADDWVACNAPTQLANIILARTGNLPFRPLSGLLATPSLRPDGSLLSTAGYDPATRMVLLNPPPMPAMPDKPGRQDALKALAILKDLLIEFPFVDGVDGASNSVALSAFLTVVNRACMAVAPGHALDAPTPGTGKSYLANLIALVGNGDYMPASTMPDDKPDQLEKLIDAAMIAGHPLLSLDNVNGEIGGDKLCVAIEQPVANVRILSTSTLVRCENRMTVFINGNNMRLRGDITRRIITSSLDAGIPQPETRAFKHRPHLMITADRGKYIAACLTIVRAYILAGRPNRLSPLASFEQWSDNIRSALAWLGCTDPVETIRAAQESDPEDLKRGAMFQALYDVFKDKDGNTTVEFTTADIVEKAAQRSTMSSEDPFSGPRLEHPTLFQAIEPIAGWRGEINRHRLGKWLAANTRRFAIGAKLKLIVGAAQTRAGTLKWRIVLA